MSEDYKELYELEVMKRRKLQEKLDVIKNVIWGLIEDDLYKYFETTE